MRFCIRNPRLKRQVRSYLDLSLVVDSLSRQKAGSRGALLGGVDDHVGGEDGAVGESDGLPAVWGVGDGRPVLEDQVDAFFCEEGLRFGFYFWGEGFGGEDLGARVD